MLRRYIFWMHLAAGVIVGLHIAILCLTGAAIAFKEELVEWAERDARRVAVPNNISARLSLSEIMDSIQVQQYGQAVMAVAIKNDAGAAIAVTLESGKTLYVNPWNGSVRVPGSEAVNDTMQFLTRVHRWLALTGDFKSAGKFIAGISNLALLLLAISGIYLWWPRRWSWRHLKAVSVPNMRLKGRAWQFNLHSSIGIWCAPILILLTLSAIPISFSSVDSVLFRISGDKLPKRTPHTRDPLIKTVPGVSVIAFDQILTETVKLYPNWQSLVLIKSRKINTQHKNEMTDVQVLRSQVWPKTAPPTITADNATGAIIKNTAFADLSPGRQIRYWTRYLHTGKAFGIMGQALAAIGAISGLLLVYSGYKLSWYRFKAIWNKNSAFPQTLQATKFIKHQTEHPT